MKIICNQGDIFSFDKSYNQNDSQDLDVNVYIDTVNQRKNKVGWKCGRRTTDYLNWISYDQMYGKPEIILVDLDKYKIKNKSSNIENTIDIIVNLCWFDLSDIQSHNPNIIINWKGFTYHYICSDIQVNTNCCDIPFIKIKVNLSTNSVRCYRNIYIPYIMYYNNDYSKYYI